MSAGRDWGALWGEMEYRLRFLRADSLDGPFNGQPRRQALFGELLRRLRPRALVETGTFRGTTTEFLARTGLPVYSTELAGLWHGFARARLRRWGNVRLIRGDSRVALRALLAGPLRERAGGPLLVYLDAHWNADLPLAEELEIVFAAEPDAVAMIDDFEVPDDPGYGYDVYHPGPALTARYVAPTVARHDLAAYRPATPSAEEGGARRGCLVLAGRGADRAALDALPLLRRSPAG